MSIPAWPLVSSDCSQPRCPSSCHYWFGGSESARERPGGVFSTQISSSKSLPGDAIRSLGNLVLLIDPFSGKMLPSVVSKLPRIRKETDDQLLKCNLQCSHMCFLINTFNIPSSSNGSKDYHNFQVHSDE